MTAGAVGLFLREYTTDLLAGVPPDLARVESQTVAVTTIILFQMLYLLDCRSLTQTFWRIRLFSNWWVYIGMLATLGLQVAFVYLESFNRLFRTPPLDASDWGMSGAVALAGFFVISPEKWFWRQKEVSSDAGEWT
jgi:magnesium-transporting ATPase (P-type)